MLPTGIFPPLCDLLSVLVRWTYRQDTDVHGSISAPRAVCSCHRLLAWLLSGRAMCGCSHFLFEAMKAPGIRQVDPCLSVPVNFCDTVQGEESPSSIPHSVFDPLLVSGSSGLALRLPWVPVSSSRSAHHSSAPLPAKG